MVPTFTAPYVLFHRTDVLKRWSIAFEPKSIGNKFPIPCGLSFVQYQKVGSSRFLIKIPALVRLRRILIRNFRCCHSLTWIVQILWLVFLFEFDTHRLPFLRVRLLVRLRIVIQPFYIVIISYANVDKRFSHAASGVRNKHAYTPINLLMFIGPYTLGQAALPKKCRRAEAIISQLARWKNRFNGLSAAYYVTTQFVLWISIEYIQKLHRIRFIFFYHSHFV